MSEREDRPPPLIPIAAGSLNGRDGDAAAGFEVLDNFEPFHQKDDVFRRSWWDEEIRSEKAALFYETYREPLKTFRRADGFTQKDTPCAMPPGM